VVEDNEDLLETTSAMLTTFGYRVLCARNGAEAIQMLKSGQEFELLFSDIVMPNGMNGVELAREARQLSKEISPAHFGLRGRRAGTISGGGRFSNHRQTLPPGRFGAAPAVNPPRSVIARLLV
jgi:CheY-like chemotaxis protein